MIIKCVAAGETGKKALFFVFIEVLNTPSLEAVLGTL